MLNFVSVSRYLGAYLGPQEEMEAWASGVSILGKIDRRPPQSAYAGLGMLLQLDWQYLQRHVPEVVTLMDPIEEALREKFFPAIFGGRVSTPTFGES